MVSNSGNWVRIFDVPDISKHRKGFTIYKIVSMLYQESCPDAITKITVWKRFNDFKKLHRNMKALHKKLVIKDKYPILPSTSFFKRFDDETVQERRQGILTFLEYIAYHPQLYTSNDFVKFFETSHTPVQVNSNISSIRADLNLPEDSEFIIHNSDDEPTISDTDSVTTLNSLHTSDLSLSKSKLSLTASHYSKNSDNVSIATTIDSITLLDGQVYPTPPNTPGVSENFVRYIIDASIHVNMAVELEREKKYEEAYTAYKAAIDILIKHGKDDKNYDRKQMVRYKTEKYLIRAEKIYNMFLSKEIQSLHKLSENDVDLSREEQSSYRSMSDLYKYKVVGVIASGMLVLHLETQKLFYIKVIHKTMEFLSDNLILPENVPYMVKLYNYYNCENALFLVLEYCSGRKLCDYIKCRADDPDDVFNQSEFQISKQIQEMELSDPESEHSYSDLINEYTNSKYKNLEPVVETLSSDGSFEKVDLENSPTQNTDETSTLYRKPHCNDYQRKFSEVSSFDEIDVTQNYFIPEETVAKWAAQLLLALDKLHSLGVICRDLQLHNLLINDNGDLILTYMCNVNDLCHALSNAKCVYLAPDFYNFQEITEAIDWWCFGSILYELLVGMPLSYIHPEGLTLQTILKVPKYVSPEGRSLLKQLLVYDPKRRLGFGPNGIENLKSHPFFNSIVWDELLIKYN